MKELKKYLETTFSFKEDTVDKIISCCEPKTIDKNDYFLREGQYCKSVAFVASGSFIYYFINDGEEKVCDFAFEQDWITQYKSLLGNIPSELNIKALENSFIQILSIEKMEVLFTEFPEANIIRSTLAEQYFTQSAEHATNLSSLKAEERYKLLLEKKPFIHQRVPQYYIASYLGIKPQSLSRIRAKK